MSQYFRDRNIILSASIPIRDTYEDSVFGKNIRLQYSTQNKYM